MKLKETRKSGLRRRDFAVVSAVFETMEDRRLLSVAPGTPLLTSAPATLDNPDAPTVIDILFTYSPAAAAYYGGRTQLYNRFVGALQFANEVMLNSGNNVFFRALPDATQAQMAYVESDAGTDPAYRVPTALDQILNTTDGKLDGLPGYANARSADLTVFCGDFTDGYGVVGIAGGIMGTADYPGNRNTSYVVIDAQFLGYGDVTLAHEIGHNLGARHARATNVTEDISNGGYYLNSYGIGVDTGDTELLDIMAYIGTGTFDNETYVPYFSNPEIYLNGVQFGNSTPSVKGADLHSTFATTAPIMAAYRTPQGAFTYDAPTAAVKEINDNDGLLTVIVEYQGAGGIDYSSLDSADVTVEYDTNTIQGDPANYVALQPVGYAVQYDGNTGIQRVAYTFDSTTVTLSNFGKIRTTVNTDEVSDLDGSPVTAGVIGFSANDSSTGELNYPTGDPNDEQLTVGLARTVAFNQGTSYIQKSTIAGDQYDVYRFDVANLTPFNFTLTATGSYSVSLVRDVDNTLTLTDSDDTIESFTLNGSGASFGDTLSAGTYYLVFNRLSGSSYSFSYTGFLVTDPNPVAQIDQASYTVAEGSAIFVTGLDSLSGDLTDVALYEWDLDYDGTTFDVDQTGSAAVFDASFIDGNTTRTIGLKVTNEYGHTSITSVQVSIVNVPPVIGVQTTTTIAQSGGNFTVVNVSDVPADELGGFTYYFDFDNDGIYDTAGSSSPTVTISPNSLGVADPNLVNTYYIGIKVVDKDGDSSTATGTIILENGAPTATFSTVTASSTGATTFAEGDQVFISMSNLQEFRDDLAAGLTVKFDLDGDGLYDGTNDYSTVITSNTLSVEVPQALINGPSTRYYSVVISDGLGASSAYTGSFTVTNTAPTAVIDASGIPNGIAYLRSTYTLHGSGSDVSVTDAAALTYRWTVLLNGSVVGTGATADFAFSPVVAGTYTFNFTVTDIDSASTTVSTTVVAQELYPSIVSISSPSAPREGGSAVFTVTLSGVPTSPVVISYQAVYGGTASGSTAIQTLTIPAGSLTGTIVIPTTNNTFADVNATAGFQIVSVLNGTNTTVSTASVGIINDDVAVTTPIVGGFGTATITGTPYADSIRIVPGTRKNTINVFSGDLLISTYTNVTKLVIDLGDGDDRLSIDSRIKIPTLIFAGAGNDSIVGGAGRDIIIGGEGADSLSGGKGENLLIADNVPFTATSADAEALFTAWNGKGTAAKKFSTLVATGGLLQSGVVSNDSSQDRVDVLGKSDFRLFSGADQVFQTSGKASRRIS